VLGRACTGPGDAAQETMKSLFLYASGDSFLHRADPRTKFLAIIVLLYFVLTTLVVPYMAAVLALVVLTLWLLGRISPREYAPVLATFLPLIAVVTLIQALVRPAAEGTYLAEVAGLRFSREGVTVGLAIGMRLMAMALTFAAFAMTTDPNDIALALTRLRIHYRYCYLTSFALRFLPLVQEEAQTLLTATAIRGSADPAARNPFKRARAVVNILLPLMVGALRRSVDISLAMELRGYRDDRPRTYTRRIGMKRQDYWLLAGIAVFAAVSFTLKSMGVLEFKAYATG
jgi:energy-coupling factor transport system permease protein